MTTSYIPARMTRDETMRDRLEKQLFRDVQRLIRYKDSRKHQSPLNADIMASYERMILERCEVLGEIARR